MTIASTLTTKQYVSTGVNTQFAFPNKIFAASDLVVTIFDLLGTAYPFTNFANATLGLTFSVQNVDVDTGCTVVLSAPFTLNWTIDIRSLVADTQSTSIKNQGQFLPELHEEAFDRATRQIQDLLRLTYTFGIHGPDIEQSAWPALPTALLRRGYALMFDAVTGLPGLGFLSAQNVTIGLLAPLLNLQQTALETLAVAAGNLAPTNFGYAPGNVLRYGADPTGVLDSTAAFNAASASMVAYGLATVLDEVLVPPGTYLINGTVYVRKGQRLHGKYGSSFITANNAGTGPTFEMGWGNPANVPTVDSGGQPPQIDNIYVLGGPSSGCVRFNNIAGAVCRDIFFSAPGLAVNIVSSNDLQLRGLFIDVHQGGISISGTAINLQVADVNFFNGKTDIQISGSVSDAQFSNLHHEYNQINCVLFADSAVIKGYKFTDCEYIYNVQYGTFTGTILNRSASAQAQFSACAFHNMPGYAYQYGTGSGSQISFNDCLFDGLRTVTISPTNYNQSTLAAAISTANETIRVSDCIFRNLPCNAGAGTPIAVGGAAQSLLEIDGASYSGNQGASLVNFSNSSTASAAVFQNIRGDALQTLVNNQSTVLVRKITGCTDWFGPIGVSGALHFILLPYQFSNLYQISFRFNQNVGGGAQYRKSKLMYFEKDNDNSAATNRSFLVSATAVEGAANINPLIAVGGEFTAVGGGNPIASSNSGNLAISWTNAYTSESIDVQMLQ